MTSSPLLKLLLEALGRPRPECYLNRLDGIWRPVSAAETGRHAARLAAALDGRLGLRPGDRVAVQADDGPRWIALDVACLAAGAALVPLHPALPPAMAVSRIRESGARAVFAAGRERLEGLLARRGDMPGVAHLVALDGSLAGEGITDLESPTEASGAAGVERLAELAGRRRSEDPASLIHTPGTTGEARGVLMTHARLAAHAAAAADALPIAPGQVVKTSGSLAGAFERTIHYACLHRGATVAFPESASTAVRDLREVRAHVTTASFQDLKRLMDEVFGWVQRGPAWRRRVFPWAAEIGRRALDHRLRLERSPDLRLALAEKLAFEDLRRLTGGRLRLLLVMGAPLSPAWTSFLWGAGIPVCEAYGLTEAAPLAAANVPGRTKLGTAGRPLPGIEVRIAGDDEVLLRGPLVAEGCAAGDGWLATGDVGRADEEGFLTVTGRKAERVRDADGRAISPTRIDGMLACSHFLSHAVVAVEPGRAPVALLFPDFERLEAAAKHHGIEVSSRAELVRDPRTRGLFGGEVKSFDKVLEAHERPRAWELVADELRLERGELTPAGAVRRGVVLEKHRDVVERLLAQGGE